MLDAMIDVHFTEYSDAIIAAGGTPVLLTRTASVGDLVERLDGIVLSGGADVDPRKYGARPGPHLGSTEPERDQFELALAEAAIEAGVPLLGICRGLQVLNVWAGGTLLPHLAPDDGEGHSSQAYPRNARTHEVAFVDGTQCAELYGPTCVVNSLHHQAVDRLGNGLVVSGRASDGVIESIELPGHAVLAVQWHPEMLRDRLEPVFPWLVQQCKEQI